jgi:hypothetical protein
MIVRSTALFPFPGRSETCRYFSAGLVKVSGEFVGLTRLYLGEQVSHGLLHLGKLLDEGRAVHYRVISRCQEMSTANVSRAARVRWFIKRFGRNRQKPRLTSWTSRVEGISAEGVLDSETSYLTTV